MEPEFATIAATLTDLMKDGNPKKIKWFEACETAFKTIEDYFMLGTGPF